MANNTGARPTVTIYTDGSSRGNPGNGGYGTVLHFVAKDGTLHKKTLSAGYKLTTNNRMEMMAAIVGLEALKLPCDVTIYSDSQYLVNAFEKNWISGWIKKNGIWTARELKEKNAECIIIFTTNYESYLDDVIGKYAFRYWVKPIDDERLRKSICEISDRMKTIAVDEFETKKRHRIRLKDIVYITTAGKHCKMITTDNEYILMQSLKDLRGKLSTINFCDCHGSYCVNLDYVEKYTKSEVYLTFSHLPIKNRMPALLWACRIHLFHTPQSSVFFCKIPL